MYIRNFNTLAEYNNIKDTLEKPCVSLVKEGYKLYYNPKVVPVADFTNPFLMENDKFYIIDEDLNFWEVTVDEELECTSTFDKYKGKINIMAIGMISRYYIYNSTNQTLSKFDEGGKYQRVNSKSTYYKYPIIMTLKDTKVTSGKPGMSFSDSSLPNQTKNINYWTNAEHTSFYYRDSNSALITHAKDFGWWGWEKINNTVKYEDNGNAYTAVHSLDSYDNFSGKLYIPDYAEINNMLMFIPQINAIIETYTTGDKIELNKNYLTTFMMGSITAHVVKTAGTQYVTTNDAISLSSNNTFNIRPFYHITDNVMTVAEYNTLHA